MRQAKTPTTCYSRAWKSNLCESSLFRSWWILLFLILSYSFYTHAMQKKAGETSFLKAQFDYLTQEKELALQEREDLVLQINSHNDSAWIELTLIKELGLVPEGVQKVYFK